jgi:hypothetical protein
MRGGLKKSAAEKLSESVPLFHGISIIEFEEARLGLFNSPCCEKQFYGITACVKTLSVQVAKGENHYLLRYQYVAFGRFFIHRF